MKLHELLAYDDIAIQCHNFPDADTIASGFAVYEYLRANCKAPLLFYAGPQKICKSNMLIMTDQLEIPVRYLTELPHEPELLVTVDCAYGESNVQKFAARSIAVIDHHICRGKLPELNEVRSDYGSCSSLIAKLYESEGMDINSSKRVATALYYGLFMDTNGLSEIGHPADKDLRDFADFDKPLLMLLQNSNLSSEEMVIAGDALKNCVFRDDCHSAYVLTEPCDPNILGFISDLILQVDSVDSCVVFCRNAAGYKLSVRSCCTGINAAEFAKFITEGVGNGGGHAGKAGGFITASAIEGNITEFISGRIISYHCDTDVMYAGKQHAGSAGMERYIKKQIVLGYVPSTDIVPDGGEIFIRMLEADLTVKSSPDIYLMIGVSGEVYPIKREVFSKRYTCCDELPVTDTEYPPTVIDRGAGRSRPLTPYMKGCRTNDSSAVNARRLTRYTKVFTEWNKDGYLYGTPGDFLAARIDDDTDFYIIKQNIFLKTYEKEQ